MNEKLKQRVDHRVPGEGSDGGGEGSGAALGELRAMSDRLASEADALIASALGMDSETVLEQRRQRGGQ